MYKYIHTNIMDTTGKGERHAYWGELTLLSVWNSVGVPKVRLGLPTPGLPNGTPGFKTTFTRSIKILQCILL